MHCQIKTNELGFSFGRSPHLVGSLVTSKTVFIKEKLTEKTIAVGFIELTLFSLFCLDSYFQEERHRLFFSKEKVSCYYMEF